MKNWLFPLWIIIDLLVAISAVALWIAAPEFRMLNISLTLFALALGALLILVRHKEILVFVRSRFFSKVLYHSVNVFLIACIFGLLNYLGNRNFREYDLTREKKNSLTDQSEKILEMVKAPLKMTVYSKREEWGPMLALLKLFQAKSSKIQLTAVDTDLRPDLVKAKGITQNGTVFLNYKNKESSFPIIDELSVDNALLKILRDEDIVLYFIKGHEELSCEDASPEGLSALCSKLRDQNYLVKDLDLSKVSEVPLDATAVFVAGPTTGFLPQEASAIERYLARGGSLFLALAPAFKANIYDNLIALGKPYGLTLGKDIVIDRLSTIQGAEATIPIVNKYVPGHPITEGFTLRTIFPLSSSVQVVPGNDTAQILAETSSFPGSWAESDLAGVNKGKAEFQEKSDKKGPIGLLGIGERIQEKAPGDSRFVLLGSSSFLVNAYQGQSGNTSLFLNAVSWMVNDEGIISLNRPGVEELPVILSAQHLHMIFIVSILLVPIIFFGCAIFIYRRRRLL